jgi:hypothetical protein
MPIFGRQAPIFLVVYPSFIGIFPNFDKKTHKSVANSK